MNGAQKNQMMASHIWAFKASGWSVRPNLSTVLKYSSRYCSALLIVWGSSGSSRVSWSCVGVCVCRMSWLSSLNHILGAPNFSLACLLIAPGEARSVLPSIEASIERVSSWS